MMYVHVCSNSHFLLFAIYCNVIFHSGSVNIINVYNDMHEKQWINVQWT